MIARIRKSMEEKDQGFTLIELLVVMVIIGILSAIAVPVFLNQRNKAYDTAAKSDVANIGRELATYFVDNAVVDSPGLAVTVTSNTTGSGSWSLTGASAPAAGSLTELKGSVSKDVAGNNSKFTAATNYWCVSLKSKSSSVFQYSSTTGPGTGAC